MGFYRRVFQFAVLMFLLVAGLAVAGRVMRGESLEGVASAWSCARPASKAQASRSPMKPLSRRQRRALLWGVLGAAVISAAATRGWFKEEGEREDEEAQLEDEV